MGSESFEANSAVILSQNISDYIPSVKSEFGSPQTVKQSSVFVFQGYFQIPQLLGLNSLRVIRGDNYCAIRAALFQVLAKKIPFLSNIGRIQEVC